MELIPLNIWLVLGCVFVLAEFLLPGLVAVFVGMGALTVALGIYLGWIDQPLYQLLAFFVSSLVYVSTIRVLVIRFFPADTVVQSIDEDKNLHGEVVEVVEKIPPKGVGRIRHSDTTWKAKTLDDQVCPVGSKVRIAGRENITYIVEALASEEKA